MHPTPVEFHPALSNHRLSIISRLLLQELADTEIALSTEVDDGYSRGCTTFARQKNRIILASRSGEYGWLSLSDSSNSLLFNIEGIPCRFSNDNAEHPQKRAVLEANSRQISFFEEIEDQIPCRFCFVVDTGFSENEDARVVFMGFDSKGTVRCRWTSECLIALHDVNAVIPEAKELPRPSVSVKSHSVKNESKDTGT